MAPHLAKVITTSTVVYHLGVYDPGTVIAGKYRIERPLGTGGMGVVVAATHLQLGTPVALKFLHHDLLQNHAVVERFMREARASAQLRGENVCRVSDVGTNERGRPFIVMELLAGQDLGTVLRNSGTLPVPTAAEVIMQACIALGEAHQLGVVHRDIKPGNLFWTQRPDGSALIKVLDFGVAKAPEEIKLSLTQTSNVVGSPGYMSPEQLKSSKTADVRSDIWSLGVVLYELVSGRKPFLGESITELALRVAMDPPPPLTGSVPPSFESVILRCLEKEPQRRFKDVADLAQALAPFVGPVRGAELAYAVSRVLRGAHTPIPTALAPAGTNTPTTLRGANAVLAPSGIRNKRSLRLPIVMATGAVVGVALALILVTGGKDKRPEATSAPAETSEMTGTTKMEAAPTPTKQEAPATKAAETKPAETTPVETRPAETKPVANAAETKAAETKAAEAKAAQAKAAQTKAAETKAETKKPSSTKKSSSSKSPKTKTTKTTKTTNSGGDIGDSRL